jgi:serine/threonine protein kinase
MASMQIGSSDGSVQWNRPARFIFSGKYVTRWWKRTSRVSFTATSNQPTFTFAVATPAYMSPEQILGKKVDGRSDLYGVGCVAFWLLTGRSVFQGATPMEIINQHVNNLPVAPSELSELSIPAALDSLVLECLEKDPAKRPQDAGALDEALTRVLGETSWTQTQARQWWEIHYPAVSGNAASSDERA